MPTRTTPSSNFIMRGEDKPFAQGNVGDYVINDNGNFRIVKPEEITSVLINQK